MISPSSSVSLANTPKETLTSSFVSSWVLYSSLFATGLVDTFRITVTVSEFKLPSEARYVKESVPKNSAFEV